MIQAMMNNKTAKEKKNQKGYYYSQYYKRIPFDFSQKAMQKGNDLKHCRKKNHK